MTYLKKACGNCSRTTNKKQTNGLGLGISKGTINIAVRGSVGVETKGCKDMEQRHKSLKDMLSVHEQRDMDVLPQAHLYD